LINYSLPFVFTPLKTHVELLQSMDCLLYLLS
jgi:hypothetical protein